MSLPPRPTGWLWFWHLLETGFLCWVFCPHYRRRDPVAPPSTEP